MASSPAGATWWRRAASCPTWWRPAPSRPPPAAAWPGARARTCRARQVSSSRATGSGRKGGSRTRAWRARRRPRAPFWHARASEGSRRRDVDAVARPGGRVPGPRAPALAALLPHDRRRGGRRRPGAGNVSPRRGATTAGPVLEPAPVAGPRRRESRARPPAMPAAAGLDRSLAALADRDARGRGLARVRAGVDGRALRSPRELHVRLPPRAGSAHAAAARRAAPARRVRLLGRRNRRGARSRRAEREDDPPPRPSRDGAVQREPATPDTGAAGDDSAGDRALDG